MKKSTAVNISFLASVAAAAAGCGPAPIRVHLNAFGECVTDLGGQPVDQRICYGYGHGSFGGSHFVYVGSESAPYYSRPGSPGYVTPWSPSFSTTVRGVFGGHGEGGGGHGAGGGE